MATIKSFTSLEQSKVLVEILPLESADMKILPFTEREYRVVPINDIAVCGREDEIPCWSLAALLGALPKGTNVSTPRPTNALGYCCWNQYDEIYADNPVDACYEMILKLHELKML